MALADTAAALQSSHASALTELEDLLAKGHDVVDNHMAQIRAGIDDVAAVASIADHPLVVSAARLVTETAGVPAPVVDGFVAGIEALVRAFPKPAEPAPPAAEVPAEPQTEPAAA